STLTAAYLHPIDRFAMRGRYSREAAILESEAPDISGAHFHQRFATMDRQFWTETGTRHRVPLVAIASSTQPQRIGFIVHRHRRRYRQQPCTPFRRRKLGPQRMLAAPAERLHRSILFVAAIGPSGKVEHPAMTCGKRSHCGILTENCRGSCEIERPAMPEPPRHVADDPPVGTCLPGLSEQGTLTADHALDRKSVG